MQGGIRNIKSLEKWFRTIGAPYFTLSYAGGAANQVILRNTAVGDMDTAWEQLETQVLAQSEVGRATMHLIVYNKEKGANNPDGRTNIDMSPNQAAVGVAGIGSLQTGYFDESKIAGMIEEAKAKEREKWEMERRIDDLEAQINAPSDDWTEKLMAGIERIGATPFGQMIAMKFLGGPLPQMPVGNVAGTPSAVDESGDTFDEDIQSTAAILGVDDATLARKMRQLVESNPEAAKQIFLQ